MQLNPAPAGRWGYSSSRSNKCFSPAVHRRNQRSLTATLTRENHQNCDCAWRAIIIKRGHLQGGRRSRGSGREAGKVCYFSNFESNIMRVLTVFAIDLALATRCCVRVVPLLLSYLAHLGAASLPMPSWHASCTRPGKATLRIYVVVRFRISIITIRYSMYLACFKCPPYTYLQFERFNSCPSMFVQY